MNNMVINNGKIKNSESDLYDPFVASTRLYDTSEFRLVEGKCTPSEIQMRRFCISNTFKFRVQSDMHCITNTLNEVLKAKLKEDGVTSNIIHEVFGYLGDRIYNDIDISFPFIYDLMEYENFNGAHITRNNVMELALTMTTRAYSITENELRTSLTFYNKLDDLVPILNSVNDIFVNYTANLISIFCHYIDLTTDIYLPAGLVTPLSFDNE